MHKIILMMLLTVVSNSAMAAWVDVGSNETTTIYVDSSTVKKAGNMAKMWHLTDYKKSPLQNSCNPHKYWIYVLKHVHRIPQETLFE